MSVNDYIEQNGIGYNVASAIVLLTELDETETDDCIASIEKAIWHLQREVKLKHSENDIYDSLKKAHEERLIKQTKQGFCKGGM